MTIDGLPLLEFIIKRVRKSKLIDEIVLATTIDKADDPLVETATRLNIQSYRGEYEDSIGRLYGAATLGEADVVVKIMGHYPLVDTAEADKMIGKLLDSDYDYAYSEHYEGIILGLGVEVFSYKLIQEANTAITSPVKRRFGSNIFKEIVDKNKMLAPKYELHRPDYRVTLAVPKDEIILNQVIEKCEELTYGDIVKYMDENPVIVKYAQQNLSISNEVGIEKILLFPEKTKVIHSCTKNKVDSSYPVSVELSLTNRCNLACKWCSDNYLRKSSMVDMDFGLLKKLFKDLADNGTRGVVIEGGGEPTIYEKFNDVVDCAKDHGLSLGLITNGIEFPYEDKLGAFDWIRLSLDAANAEQYHKGKGRDLFDRVISNIQKITRRKNAEKLVVGIGFVATRDNVKNIDEVILNLRRINVNYIQIRPVIDHPDMLPDNLKLDYLQKYAANGFSVNVHNMSENVIKGNFNLPCRVHSLSSVIAANGDVFLCGRLNIYDWVRPIGNLYENSFHEIWHSNERIKQSQTVMDSNFCRKWCPECRLTKYNVLFNNASAIKTGDFI